MDLRTSLSLAAAAIVGWPLAALRDALALPSVTVRFCLSRSELVCVAVQSDPESGLDALCADGWLPDARVRDTDPKVYRRRIHLTPDMVLELVALGKEGWFPGNAFKLAGEIRHVSTVAIEALRRNYPRATARTLEPLSWEESLGLAWRVLNAAHPTMTKLYYTACGGRVPNVYNGGRGADSDALTVMVLPCAEPPNGEGMPHTERVIQESAVLPALVIAMASRTHMHGVPMGQAASENVLVEGTREHKCALPPALVGARVLRAEKRPVLEALAAACDGKVCWSASNASLMRLYEANLLLRVPVEGDIAWRNEHGRVRGSLPVRYRGTDVAVEALDLLASGAAL